MRALLLALGLNGSFLLVELVVGLWSGSLALLSDAAHMASDVGALLLALGAARIAQRAASGRQTFGWRRAEPLGAFVNGLVLVAVSAWIVWEAAHRIGDPPDIPGLPVLVVGVIGLAINLGSAWVLARADRDNLNVRGALLHMMADALGSVGAIAAAIAMMAGFPLADPIVSVAIALLVLWGTWGLLRDSTSVLLQFAPANVNVDEIRRTLTEHEGVDAVHDLHVWTLDGRSTVLTAHLDARAGADRDCLCQEVSRTLRDTLGVAHVTLQVTLSGTPCPGGCCHDPASPPGVSPA
jgi:cobalt-zinc-cadmium efflux system protein